MSSVTYLLVFGSAFLLGCGLLSLLWGQKNEVLERLNRLMLNPGEQAANDASKRSLATILGSGLRETFNNIIVRLGSALPSGGEEGRHETVMRLLQAGYRAPNAPTIFMGVRLFAALAAPVVVGLIFLILGKNPFAAQQLLICIVMAMLGYLLPNFVLNAKIGKRRGKIRDAVPDALDLLVICVEAGLGLDAGILRVSEEFSLSAPELAEELRTVNLSMRAGRKRADALRSLAERTGVEEINGLVAMLIQADKFGTSISDSLKVFSESMRLQRKQAAEEAAAKTTIKLVFPLVFFIFPSLFIMLLGPAVIQVLENLAPVAGQ